MKRINNVRKQYQISTVSQHIQRDHYNSERGFLLFWFYSLVNLLVYKLVDFSLCFILKFSQVTSPGEVLLTNREKGQVTNSCRFYTSGLLKVL